MTSEGATGPDAAAMLCPRCGREFPPRERLCAVCRMPLVVAGGDEQAPLGPGHEEARKINPRFARGELVRVAVGRNLAEAELIKGVLLEQGIPSMLRRTGGFDVPDFIAAGPRDVLVPGAGEEAARELLGEVEEADAARAEGGADGAVTGTAPPAFKLAAVLLAAILAFSAIAGIVYVLAA